MDMKPLSHIYECCPSVFGNEDKSITVKLKCIPKPDFDAQAIYEATLGVEARRKSTHEFINKYFDSVEGLTVAGEEIKTLDDIYRKVPGDLYAWIQAAVLSLEVLTKAEIKN